MPKHKPNGFIKSLAAWATGLGLLVGFFMSQKPSHELPVILGGTRIASPDVLPHGSIPGSESVSGGYAPASSPNADFTPGPRNYPPVLTITSLKAGSLTIDGNNPGFSVTTTFNSQPSNTQFIYLASLSGLSNKAAAQAAANQICGGCNVSAALAPLESAISNARKTPINFQPSMQP